MPRADWQSNYSQSTCDWQCPEARSFCVCGRAKPRCGTTGEETDKIRIHLADDRSGKIKVLRSALARGRMERAKGIEPSYAAWEAAVLPLNYARSPLVPS